MANPKPVCCEFGETCQVYPCAHRGLHLKGDACYPVCEREPQGRNCTDVAGRAMAPIVVDMMRYIEERIRVAEAVDGKRWGLDRPGRMEKGTGIL